jgi:ferrous iron transport protein A
MSVIAKPAAPPPYEHVGREARITLDRVPLGADARVTGLDLDGLLRRRLLDLGFVLGTLVRPLRRSPFGDPTAYEVMGSVVALRRSEAARIRVSVTAFGGTS